MKPYKKGPRKMKIKKKHVSKPKKANIRRTKRY